VQKHIQAAFLEFPNKSLKAFISRGTKGAIVLLQSPFLLSQHFHFFFHYFKMGVTRERLLLWEWSMGGQGESLWPCVNSLYLKMTLILAYV